MAADLARSGVEAVFTRGSTATRALQRASQTLPIITGVGDPMGSGFAQPLARPGGSITGISYAFAESTQKQLQLLREVVPRLAHLTIIQRANRRGDVAEGSPAVEAAAQTPGLPTRRVQMADAGGLMNYRLDWDNQTQRSATPIDKLLRGGAPGRIPFEFPTRSDLAINASTAATLGLSIQPALQLRADLVIE